MKSKNKDQTDLKICIDCKHLLHNTISICNHPAGYVIKRDPVNGDFYRGTVEGFSPLPAYSRYSGGFCGPNGKYFEKRLTLIEQLKRFFSYIKNKFSKHVKLQRKLKGES